MCQSKISPTLNPLKARAPLHRADACSNGGGAAIVRCAFAVPVVCCAATACRFVCPQAASLRADKEQAEVSCRNGSICPPRTPQFNSQPHQRSVRLACSAVRVGAGGWRRDLSAGRYLIKRCQRRRSGLPESCAAPRQTRNSQRRRPQLLQPRPRAGSSGISETQPLRA